VGPAPRAGRDQSGKQQLRRLSTKDGLFQTANTTPESIQKEKAMNATRKVLVVDDDPAVRKSIDRVLSGSGYAVITAENGEEAMRKLNEEKYDLVYTDIRMPGMSGLDVAEQVKARRPWTPVVIITGYGTEAAEARAKAAGVSNFMHKPLSPEMIEDSARDALAAPAVAANVVVLPVAAEAPATESAATGSVLKNIALFFAAPFIGLAYIVALPLVGFGFLAVLAARAASKFDVVKKVTRTLRHIGMFIAAPFLGLAAVVFFPFIGLAMLMWMGGKAAMARVKG
jgi:CheY-like chemotaxis protein